MKRFNYKKIIPFLVLFVVISLTVGYSAFGNNMNISGIVAEVRVNKDIRVTGISIDSSSGNSLSVGENYNHNSIFTGVTLPQADSSVTYKVEVTNIGNVEMGIYDFVGLPENLEIVLQDYNLQDAICDDTKCSLGVVKEFLLTIKYKENGFDSTNIDYDLKLDVDFRQMYSVTYEGIVYHDYQSKVMEGATLSVEFTEDIPKAVRAYVGSVKSTDYTYENNIVTVNNITDNVTIKYLEKVYLKVLSSGSYFKESAYVSNIKTVSFVDYVDTTDALATYDLGDTGYEGEITGWIDSNYNLYIGSDWDIYAKNLSSAFYNMSAVENIAFSNLNTSETTNMYAMFFSCSLLTNLDVSNFNTANVTNMSYMFYNCSSLTSLDLGNFNTTKVTSMFCMFDSCSALTSLNVSNFNTARVTNMRSMFYKCSALTSLNVSSFNTANVTSMSSMFSLCSALTNLDLTNFDTAKVTDMSSMFGTCKSLTSLNVSSFNTAKVTSMSMMFNHCESLMDLDVTSFDTSIVTNMLQMFSTCKSLTSLDVSSFNTSSVKSMQNMFHSCSLLTKLDLSNFNTANVTTIQRMFYGCSSLTSLNISSFDTSNVKSMEGLFMNCSSLTSLDLSKFSISSVTDMSSIFSGCSSLVTINLDNLDFYNSSYITSSSGMFNYINTAVVITVMDADNKTWIEGKLPSGSGTVNVATA